MSSAKAIDWIINFARDRNYNYSSKSDLEGDLASQSKQMRGFVNSRKVDWFDKQGDRGKSVTEDWEGFLSLQVKKTDNPSELEDLKSKADNLNFDNLVEEIKNKLNDIMDQDLIVESNSIKNRIKNIKNEQDADELYREIESLPTSPERDNIVTNLNNQVFEKFGSLEDQFIRDIQRESDINYLENSISKAPTTRAENAVRDKIRELSRE